MEEGIASRCNGGPVRNRAQIEARFWLTDGRHNRKQSTYLSGVQMVHACILQRDAHVSYRLIRMESALSFSCVANTIVT